MHSTAGYLLYSKYTCENQFNVKKNSIILTGSDAGWINGHSYALYGPLSIGATSVLVEKPYNLTNINFLIKVLKKLKVTTLYLPVTILRIIKSYYLNKNLKIKSLKTIGSMGEPLAPNVAKWYSTSFLNKKKCVVNTYFQTETGGIICSPKYKDKSYLVPHGSVGRPALDDLGVYLFRNKNRGEMLIKNPWPGCMINIINGYKYWKKYWNTKNHFRMFDICSMDTLKNFYVHGRTDDVINIRGHRIGSEEVESVILKNNDIEECCAVSVFDEIEGNKFVLFAVTSKNNITNPKKINDDLFKSFGSYAIPKKIFFVKELPKTRSGKILRRLLRKLLEGRSVQSLGDVSTILNSSSISLISKLINKNT